jgi:hypothetical protein
VLATTATPAMLTPTPKIFHKSLWYFCKATTN